MGSIPIPSINFKHMNRLQRRKDRKRQRNKELYHTRKDWNAPRCHDCGGQTSWCSICEMYSQNCCIPYGTCLCSWNCLTLSKTLIIYLTQWKVSFICAVTGYFVHFGFGLLGWQLSLSISKKSARLTTFTTKMCQTTWSFKCLRCWKSNDNTWHSVKSW